MIRQASRHLLRQTPLRTQFPHSRRFVSTAPPAQRSRSWRSTAVRWGLAAGIVYYYNTSNVFADEPAYATPPAPSPTEETPLPTLEEIAQSRQKKQQSLYPSESSPSSDDLTSSTAPTTLAAPPSSLSPLEGEEAEGEYEGQAGAFNEETGEINWDCPCLGGMAHGPCGEEFRTAFSCFVFSKEEPKGMDCIDHFKGMQTCFRDHPEHYGAELEEEEAEARALAAEQEEDAAAAAIAGAAGEGEHGIAGSPAMTISTETSPPTSTKAAETLESSVDAATNTLPSPPSSSPSASPRKPQQLDKPGNPLGDTDEPVPRSAHDATAANEPQQ